MSILKINILTPEKKIASFECTKLVAEGSEGQLVIYPGHTRFITGLRICEIIMEPVKKSAEGTRTKESKLNYFVSGGYLHVEDDVVTIFTPSSEEVSDIDQERAKTAKDKAEKVLSELKDGTDTFRAQNALERAIKRLTLAGKKLEK